MNFGVEGWVFGGGLGVGGGVMGVFFLVGGVMGGGG